ncbi:Mbov_0121 family peptidase domain-containing ABC transporter [Mesomycoplasma moatsii]|uniref:Mbov_0121 family peptidase domain-containing ABC transporter n=1 Tax=Mesomycoplasma moatsii TaxID=171287 RepID=UPI0003B4148F
MQYREQVSKLDCGISVVQVLHKYYFDKWIDLVTLKKDVSYDANGINLLELTNLAKKFGINFEILKGDFESFKKIKIEEPIISIIKNDGFLHYVVIEKITSKNNVIYFDPILGKQKIFLDDFEKIYFGLIIVCSKGTVKNQNKEKEIISLFKLDFLKEKIWISLSSLIVIILSFIGSFYMKLILDQIIATSLQQQLLIITFLFILILVIKIVLNLLNEFIVHKLDIKYQLLLLNKYIEKLSTIKWEKISYIDESTHLKNLEMLIKIATFKSRYLFDFVIQLFSFVSAGIFLLILEPKIFLLTLFTSFLTIIISVLFQKKFKTMEKRIIKESTLFKKSYLNIINGIEQFKLNSTKQYLKNSLDNKLNSLVKNQVNATNVGFIYNFLQSTIKNIIPFIIIVICVNELWKNNITIGELFLFVSMFGFFASPLLTFASMIIDYSIIKQYLENINSFLLIDDEIISKNKFVIDEIKNIKLENVKFRYKEGNNLLKINNLLIDSKINITGKNGSGKSTLLKLISSLIINSNIYYNDKNIEYYDIESLRKNICLVSNNEYLPYGSIYDYLSSNKENTNLLLKNIEKYKLLDLFELMNLNFHTLIEEGGKNLSSGQKQFISLMKVFSSNYSLVLLDEAFENIDKKIIDQIFSKLRIYLKEKIVIEISHQKNYLFNEREINCELFK